MPCFLAARSCSFGRTADRKEKYEVDSAPIRLMGHVLVMAFVIAATFMIGLPRAGQLLHTSTLCQDVLQVSCQPPETS
jgi:hypothetical protein